jgi:hypothetical protein
VPQLDTYIGPETPNPLFITLLRSKHAMPTMESVLKDILGLTRINYNSCNYNDSLPVMVRFAKMVGEVLTMGSAKGSEKQPFKLRLRGGRKFSSWNTSQTTELLSMLIMPWM